MELYLIRHTTPDVENGLCYGQSEVPLSRSFSSECKFLQDQLPGSFDALFTSPSRRCRILSEQFTSEKFFVDARLLELSFGAWEMKRWAEIDPRTVQEWMANFVNQSVPGGESFAQLFSRVNDFIRDLLANDYSKVAIVTHAGVIRCFVAYILAVPLHDAFKISVDYASITSVHVDGDASLQKVLRLNMSRTASVHSSCR
ncbi:MAG TPA: alpha-ribazole phosphatase [Bacteroidota bacterium]